MIKKYKQFLNEGVLDNLTGPSEEELWNNFKDYSPQLLLEKSIIIGFLDGIKKAIENGANLQIEEVIYTAALFGDEDIIKYLLDAGALVTNEVVMDIEHELIEENETSKKTIDNINLIKSYIKEVPKQKVSKFKNFVSKFKHNEGILDKLKGPSEEEIKKQLDGLYGFKLLKKSCKLHYLPGIIQGLNEEGDNINFVLKLCLESNYIDGVDYALKNGADKNFIMDCDDEYDDVFEVKPLGYAAYNGYIDMVEYLLTHGYYNKEELDEAINISDIIGKEEIIELLNKYKK